MALLLCGANIAFAEESGVFFGFGVGYGDIKSSINATAMHGYKREILYDTTNKHRANGKSYGLTAGYKQFITESVGFRYYANVDLTHANAISILGESNNLSNSKYPILQTNLLNYGVNVDVLFNFVSNNAFDFGGFIGFGIGANMINGKYVDSLQQHKDDYVFQTSGGGLTLTDSKVQTTSLDIALNMGLRTNIAKYHGIELAVRVPLIPIKTLDVGMRYDVAIGTYVDVAGKLQDIFAEGKSTSKATLGQNFRVLARYTFSF